MPVQHSFIYHPEEAAILNQLSELIARLKSEVAKNRTPILTPEEVNLLAEIEPSYANHVSSTEDRIFDRQI